MDEWVNESIKMNFEKKKVFEWLYLKCPVQVVASKLNSATGIPRLASWGANMAAGYTTDDVPT